MSLIGVNELKERGAYFKFNPEGRGLLEKGA